MLITIMVKSIHSNLKSYILLLRIKRNYRFKVAPYSLVQFINYLYGSVTSDVILTTFAWNFRGSANNMKQAVESCF